MSAQKSSGVCRDLAYLAVAFCRTMNIPARYCTVYLSDVGLPRAHPAGDFDAADVAIATTVDSNTLQQFRVWTDQIIDRSTCTSDSGA